jgi:hypothetical protein
MRSRISSKKIALGNLRDVSDRVWKENCLRKKTLNRKKRNPIYKIVRKEKNQSDSFIEKINTAKPLDGVLIIFYQEMKANTS